MEKRDIEEVEQEIGYEFANKRLLEQAFTRKSYTDERRGGCNSEILEFYGDRVLDLIVVKELAEYFGHEDEDGFSCSYDEGECTVIKKRLVNSKSLSSRIDDLGFAKHLIMSKGDVQSNAQEQTHVKEDLFEAIIGAVAVDCNWDLGVLQDTVELMLHLDQYFENDMEEYEDYVSLIQQWSQKKTGALPSYVIRTAEEENEFRKWHGGGSLLTIKASDFGKPVRSNTIDSGNRDEDSDFVCHLYLEGKDFVGYGYSKSEARMDAAGTAYAYLDEHGLLITMADEIGDPAPDKAVSQLQELAQKGYFALPEYTYEEAHDGDGNPVWTCACRIEGYKYYYTSRSSSKKESKRGAAYAMLKGILSHDNEPQD